MKKTYSIIVMVFIASIILMGCSSGGSDSEDSGSSSGEQDTLVFGQGGDATSLDPGAQNDSESTLVLQQIYETLVTLDEDAEVVPELAEEWDISDDGMTYTFHLKEGVSFHNGEEFNADAVVYNFERWMNGGEEFIMFATSFGLNSQPDHLIETVEALDEHTVEFKLNRPQSTFLHNLAIAASGIGSPEGIEEHGEKTNENPIGTGPFKFVEWKRSDQITLEKNEDYWEEGYPKMDRVIFKAITENEARLTALKTGEIDLMVDLSPSDVEEVQNSDDFELFSQPGTNTGYIGLTLTREPFDNKKVRQALNYAINKQEIIETFYNIDDEVSISLIPPSLSTWIGDELDAYEYDPEKAKELLAEAGYPDGFDMELWLATSPRVYMPNPEPTAVAIQEDLSKVGIEVDIRTAEQATFLSKGREGETDAHLTGWTNPNASSDGMLFNTLGRKDVWSNFADDEFHDILVEAQQSIDTDDSDELYRRAQEIVHEDAILVPLAHTNRLLVGKSNIVDFNPIGTKISVKTLYFE